MSDIYVESVYLSGGNIYVKDIEGNIYDLAKMGCGCSTPRANVIATLLRGVDGKDGKDGKTQDLSEYYKKGEVDGKLKQKQDTISNLDTIRANAEKGATAVQPSELAKVATSGSYNDLSDTPTIPPAVTERTVSSWGFTKNTGTITEVKMNGVSKGANGIVDLGTVITEHQDISGKQDEITDLDTIRSGAKKGATSAQGVLVNRMRLTPDSEGYISLPTIPTKNDIANMGFTQNKGTVTGVMINGESKSPNSAGIVDLGTIEGGGGTVSFINNDSLQGLPFGYIGGYYRFYEFDGVSSEEVNLGYIDNYYYDAIAIAYDDRLFEEKIRDLKGDGKVLGTVGVRVDESYNLYVKQVAPKKTTFGWRIYTDKQLMPDSWVDLGSYYTKSEVDSAIATAITTTLNTPV